MNLAVPSKALGQDRDPLHPAVPFTGQYGARPHVGGQSAWVYGALAGVVRWSRAVEQPDGHRKSVTRACSVLQFHAIKTFVPI